MVTPAPTAHAKRRFQSAGGSHANPYISAPPRSASDSQTGDSASQTGARLAYDAKPTNMSAAVPLSETA